MDNINHPKHYASGKIEVIEFIEDQGFGPGFCKGNAIKYIARAGKKDATKEIEDLEKASWYIKREIEILKAASEKRNPTRPNDMNPKDEGIKFVAQDNINMGDIVSLDWAAGRVAKIFSRINDAYDHHFMQGEWITTEDADGKISLVFEPFDQEWVKKKVKIGQQSVLKMNLDLNEPVIQETKAGIEHFNGA